MTLLDEVRTVFRDGERLTAGRLNTAVAAVRTMLRRTLVGPLSPGVALGLNVTTDLKNDVLVVSPGIAIDRRGRILVFPATQTFSLDEIDEAVGGLGAGETARVGLGLTTTGETDPCAAVQGDLIERATVRFRKLTSGPFIPLFIPLFGTTPTSLPTLDVPETCVDAFGDLDAPSSDVDGCSVALGTVSAVTVGESLKLSAGVSNRLGVSPRVDGLRNSFGAVVMELRPRTERAGRAHFVAPAGGPDVQATRLAYSHSKIAAARVSPTSGHVAEFAGGTPSGSLPPGVGGLVTIPMVLQSSSPPVAVGTIVEIYRPQGTDPPPAAPGALTQLGGDPTKAFGLVGAPTYVPAVGTTVAPLAATGVMQALVSPPGDVGFEAGQPLKAANPTTLVPATAPTDLVIAVAAEAVSATEPVLAHVFVVHPPRFLGA